ATTPPEATASKTDPNQDAGLTRDITIAAAYRAFLDQRFDPTHVSIAERYYANHIPHAEIVRLEVQDAEVVGFDRAITEEIGLLLNWASGAVRLQLNAEYVLPRLSGIISGDLPLWPGGRRIPKEGSRVLRGILARMLLVSHCGDFLFEDMFRDFRVEWTE